MVTKTVVGSNTMVLTALPLEDSEFVAWYTSLSDLRKDKRYSEANPLRVDMKGTQKYFYAYFKNPNVNHFIYKRDCSDEYYNSVENNNN